MYNEVRSQSSKSSAELAASVDAEALALKNAAEIELEDKHNRTMRQCGFKPLKKTQSPLQAQADATNADIFTAQALPHDTQTSAANAEIDKAEVNEASATSSGSSALQVETYFENTITTNRNSGVHITRVPNL